LTAGRQIGAKNVHSDGKKIGKPSSIEEDINCVSTAFHDRAKRASKRAGQPPKNVKPV